jgi:hypothetical protein
LTGTLIIFPRDAVPVVLLGFVALPTVPAFFEAELLKGFKVQFGGIGFLVLHPGGLSEVVIAIELPVLLFPGSTDVTFLTGLNMLVFPVLSPEGGSTLPAGVGRPVCPLVIGPVLLPEGGSAFVRAAPAVVR